MPVLVKIQCPRGKKDSDIRIAISKINDVVCKTLNEKPENVRITVLEIEGNKHTIGGKTLEELGFCD